MRHFIDLIKLYVLYEFRYNEYAYPDFKVVEGNRPVSTHYFEIPTIYRYYVSSPQFLSVTTSLIEPTLKVDPFS